MNHSTNIFLSSQNLFNQPNLLKLKFIDTYNTTNENQHYIVRTPKKASWMCKSELMEIESTGQKSNEIIVEQQDTKQKIFVWRDNFFDFGKAQHVRINRGRLLDWFVDICTVTDQSWQTLWASIKILDMLIKSKGKINVMNIHLYGTTAFFMASKYHQQKKTLTLDLIIKEIVYGKFNRKQILACENEIFTWMLINNNDKTLHFPTVEDLMYEFCPNLMEQLAKKVMIEIFYVYQDPYNAFGQEINITQRDLVKDITHSIVNGERYRNCWEVQDFYLSKYSCYSIRMFGEKLRL